MPTQGHLDQCSYVCVCVLCSMQESTRTDAINCEWRGACQNEAPEKYKICSRNSTSKHENHTRKLRSINREKHQTKTVNRTQIILGEAENARNIKNHDDNSNNQQSRNTRCLAPMSVVFRSVCCFPHIQLRSYSCLFPLHFLVCLSCSS